MNLRPYIKQSLLVLIIAIVAILIGRNNAMFYKSTVAKIVDIQTTKDTKQMEASYTSEIFYIQSIKLKIQNGENKGDIVETVNNFDETTASTEHYHLFDQVFIDRGYQDKIYITGVKRDWVLFTCLSIFITLAILIGKRKGGMAILSIVLNILIVMVALPFLLKHNYWLPITILCALLFSVTSFLCIHGISKQCIAGLLGTVASSLVSVGIGAIVIVSIHQNGLDYDQMEYLTTITAERIFIMEIIIGGLGAIIDIANTMNTVVRELCLQNDTLTPKELWRAGMDAGKDIMGTMTNVLFFVFLAGSIPQFVLWISNNVGIGEVLKYLLSLELSRALIGGISVVLSIPISLYIAIVLQKGVVKWP